MSILEKMNKAIEEIDTFSMEEILHDDFEFYLKMRKLDLIIQ